MNNLIEKAKSLLSFGSRKRKRSPEEEADEKVSTKLAKLEDRYDYLDRVDVFYEDSETVPGELEDYTIYDISDVLVEQEKIFLRKDPYGSNFFAATWSNDGTLVRKDAPIAKWIPRLAYIESDILPEEIFAEILSHCDPSTLAAMMRVSMAMNKMLCGHQTIWRKLFYRRHWRLKHDIENNFVGTDPDLADRSNWANVVPDNQVDWFGEYKRNHINAKNIKRTVEEIKSKLQRFVDNFAEVKEGVTTPLFFEPGVTDEEIDDRIIIDGIPITNDLRELLKCCNGARFKFDAEIEDYFYYHGFRILFPSLEKLSVGQYTMRHFLRSVYSCDSYLESSYSEEEYLETEDVPQELRTPIPNPKLTFEASEMQSDSDEYTMSDDESVDDDDEVSTDEKFSDQKPILNDKLILFNIVKYQRDETDAHQQIYCPETGSIDCFDCIFHNPKDFFSSISVYLQLVSDYLDCGHSVKWLKFDDYVVGEYAYCESYLDVMQEPWQTGYGQTITTLKWDRTIDELLDYHSGALKILPRANKLLYAAAQDFLIKVFTKAWSLETTNTLQPDTLIEAAHQVTDLIDDDYQRTTSPEGKHDAVDL